MISGLKWIPPVVTVCIISDGVHSLFSMSRVFQMTGFTHVTFLSFPADSRLVTWDPAQFAIGHVRDFWSCVIPYPAHFKWIHVPLSHRPIDRRCKTWQLGTTLFFIPETKASLCRFLLWFDIMMLRFGKYFSRLWVLWLRFGVFHRWPAVYTVHPHMGSILFPWSAQLHMTRNYTCLFHMTRFAVGHVKFTWFVNCQVRNYVSRENHGWSCENIARFVTCRVRKCRSCERTSTPNYPSRGHTLPQSVHLPGAGKSSKMAKAWTKWFNTGYGIRLIYTIYKQNTNRLTDLRPNG